MSDSKIRVNLREGTFEVEGSESFVAKCWEEFRDHLSTLPITISSEPPSQIVVSNNKTNTTKKHIAPSKKTYELISVDVQDDGTHPALKEFFQTKSPKTNQEMITVFAYYLNKYLGIKNMQPGQALFCFSAVNKPKPLGIQQLFSDTKYHHGWVDVKEPGTVTITIGGENFVEHELPKVKNDKK